MLCLYIVVGFVLRYAYVLWWFCIVLGLCIAIGFVLCYVYLFSWFC